MKMGRLEVVKVWEKRFKTVKLASTNNNSLFFIETFFWSDDI
jgi:hypothetical protein